MARKLLLADDSVTAQNMGRRILTEAGYEVVTVNNGSAALNKIAESKPAVVVLDVYMPGSSGLEVCARIKEDRDTAGIPVLLSVGKLERFPQEEARKVHADALIIKPFEASELLAALSRLESKSGTPAQEKTAGQAPTSADEETKEHVRGTMAGCESEVSNSAPRFGDQQSAWKPRLTIPPLGFKRKSEEVAETAANSRRPTRELDQDTRDHPALFVTRLSPASESSNSLEGRASDVSGDELADIAKPAVIGNGNGRPDFERDTESRAPKAEAVTLVSESEPAHHETVFPAAGSSARTAVTASDSSSVAIAARWVAEEIPVEPAQSALVLEREMRNALAAVAATGHGGCYEPGRVGKNHEPAVEGRTPPAIGALMPLATSTEASSVVDRDIEPAWRAEQSGCTAGRESPSSEISAPPPAPEALAPAAPENPKHAVVPFDEPPGVETAETSAAPKSEQLGQTALEGAPSPFRALRETAASPEGWRELDEPGSHSPNSGGNGNSPSFEDFTSDKGTAGEPENKPESASMAASGRSAFSSSDASLSSIVDTMLAELKPKLIAELAKKLEKK